MEQRLQTESAEAIRVQRKRLAQAKRRIAELDRLFIKIYGDNAKGILLDERFSLMSKTYEEEQAGLKAKMETLLKENAGQGQQAENLEQFIQRAHKYSALDGLTPYALRELAKDICIEAPDKSSGKRLQGICIVYDLVGFIPLE